MKILKTYEQFIQQIPHEEANPDEDQLTEDEIKNKEKEDQEKQELEVSPNIEIKLDKLRDNIQN